MMSTLPRTTLTVTRLDAGSFVNGLWVEGSPSTFDIQCSVQPLTPDEMELVPEGRRDGEVFNLFTGTRLLPANPPDSKNADKVSIDGRDYEVLSCARWQNRILPHYKAVVVQI